MSQPSTLVSCAVAVAGVIIVVVRAPFVSARVGDTHEKQSGHARSIRLGSW
jgi:hypothetical protein